MVIPLKLSTLTQEEILSLFFLENALSFIHIQNLNNVF